MAPQWVLLFFQPLPGAFGCRGLQGGLLVRFFGGSSTIFVPAGSAILNVLVSYRTFRIFHWNFVTSTAWPLGSLNLTFLNEDAVILFRFRCFDPRLLLEIRPIVFDPIRVTLSLALQHRHCGMCSRNSERQGARC